MALDRCGGALRLAELAQKVVALQRAALDGDHAILRRGAQQRLDGRHERLARGLDADRLATAAEHRDGVGFVGELERVRGDLVAGQAHQLERVLGIVHGAHQDGTHAFRHQPGVGAEDQVEEHARRGMIDEAVGVRRPDRDHGERLLPIRSPALQRRSAPASAASTMRRPHDRRDMAPVQPKPRVRNYLREPVCDPAPSR